MTPQAPKQALAGVRVLDFSWAASGPLSTLYLSLLGAEVIKVESARSLDIARRGYYTVVDDINASPNFNDMHMGKLSIRLDLRHPKAKELVLRLVALCDAAVENFRPGTLDKFGLGYEALRQARPDLIMVSSSTAGQTGPERAMPGYATTFGALGGLGGVTGYRGGPATELWDSIDMRLGTSITLAALIGLYDRRRTGRGQYVDFSSREVISATIGDSLLGYFMTGDVPGPKGNEDEVMAPHDCYPCLGDDRWVSIAVSTEASGAPSAPCPARAGMQIPDSRTWRRGGETAATSTPVSPRGRGAMTPPISRNGCVGPGSPPPSRRTPRRSSTTRTLRRGARSSKSNTPRSASPTRCARRSSCPRHRSARRGMGRCSESISSTSSASSPA